jgi:small conductance mechanosensitive channel
VATRVVSWQDFQNFLDYNVLGVTLSTILTIIVITVAALVLERLITRYVRRFANRARIEPHVANNIALTFRILILIGTVALIVRLGGLTTDWVVALTALGGAALGFASSKTIGNFVAGLYLIAARPFKVGDLVKIGTVEGIVEEITINYTKLLSIGNNTVSVSNLQIMDRDITNYAYEEERHRLFCYTFEMAFDHSISTTAIAEIFEKVFENHSELPKKPEFMMLRSGGFERVYLIYLYVKFATDVFSLRPRIAHEVFTMWDEARAKNRSA